MKSSRLKNFCEVCRKQCRDQNGFHCHLNSAHHQKRLRELATNPQEHIEKYSNELQNRIVQTLKVKYPGQPKDIQQIYEEYTEDKHHIRFNYTKWKDLAQFVNHLRTLKNLSVVGSLPYCKVTYVVSKASDFMKKKKQQQIFKRKQREKQIAEKTIEDRYERMRKIESQRYKLEKQKMQKLQNDQEQEQIDLEKQQFRFEFDQKTYQPNKIFTANQYNSHQKSPQNSKKQITKEKNIQKLLIELQNRNKEAQGKQMKGEEEANQQQWILPGIVVKVLPHQIPEAFHNKKATIVKVVEPYVAEIKIGNATLNIDQSYLETVIPKTGHQVKLLKGKFRNQNGVLIQAKINEGIGNVEISGQTLQIPFNQFSKTE